MRAAFSVLVLLLPAIAACESPRERACRSLTIQATNAEQARTTADRARSAARWLRSNAVEDAELAHDRDAIADSLERFADTRSRLEAAGKVLGAHDAASVVATVQRLDALWKDAAAASALLGASSTQCETRANATELVSAFVMDCARTLEAEPGGEALAKSIGANAAWLREAMPMTTIGEAEGARAKALPAVGDRARAEADVAAGVAVLRAHCGS